MKILKLLFFTLICTAHLSLNAQKLPALIPYHDLNEVWGYADSTGKIKVKPKYDKAEALNKGFAKVKLGDKVGLINEAGKELIPVNYETIDDISEGFVVAYTGNDYHIFSVVGKNAGTRLEVKGVKTLNYAESFSSGLALVKEDSTAIYINKEGKIILKTKYVRALSFNGAAAIVGTGGKDALIDVKGKLLTDFTYDQIYSQGRGLFKMRIGYVWGLMNDKGKVIKELYYQDIVQSNGNLWIVKQSGMFGLMNDQGKEIFKPKFYSINVIAGRDNLFEIKDRYQDVYGIIDSKGNQLLAPKYKDIGAFNDHYAWIQDDLDRFALIDTTGNFVTVFKYQAVLPYNKTAAPASIDRTEWMLVDAKGLESEKQVFWIGEGKEGSFPAMTGGKVGYIDGKFETVIPYQFIDANPFKNGIAQVGLKQFNFYIDKYGRKYTDIDKIKAYK
ncbi:MAG: WG repeat-containing protein [Bacteroidota bacterium]|nr:WG repeat-containing protein [Bacteroidota bacterium]